MMTQDILFAQQGQIGVVTLNRPSALNALTLAMILSLQKQLSAWKSDPSIHAVVIRAASGNAFCAGGDVRWLYQEGLAQHHEQQMEFFWHEYRLNHFIHHLGKPYIAFMDGVTMGGGVGISLHGSHPIASERFIFAMPETTIGFFPDIGASYLLTRCCDSLGMYLGLTGSRLAAHDAKKAGLIKHIISADLMDNALEALSNEDLSSDAFARVDACLLPYITKDEIQQDSLIHPLIASCFAHAELAAIKNALVDARDPWADKILHILEKKSPLSLHITATQLRRAQGLSLASCLIMDFNLVNHFMRGHDFYEGVRALLIDKDNQPFWNPERWEQISEQQIIDYFEPWVRQLEI